MRRARARDGPSGLRWRLAASGLGLAGDRSASSTWAKKTIYISTLGRAEVWRAPYLATLGPPPLEYSILAKWLKVD